MKNLITQLGIIVTGWVTFITTFKDFVDLQTKIPITIFFVPEKWIVTLYLLIVVVACACAIWLNQKQVIEDSKVAQNTYADEKEDDEEEIETSKRVRRAIRRIQLLQTLRAIRTLGIAYFCVLSLKKYFNISGIDEFSKPSYWDDFPEDQDKRKIIRFSRNGKRIELRFSKIGFNILARETIDDTSNFGDYTVDQFSIQKYGFLILICPLYIFIKKIGF